MALVNVGPSQTRFSMYTNQKRSDGQIHRIAGSEKNTYKNTPVDQLRRSRVRTVGG